MKKYIGILVMLMMLVVDLEGQASIEYKAAGFGSIDHGKSLEVDRLWVDGKEEVIWQYVTGSLYLEGKNKEGEFRPVWLGKGSRDSGSKIEGNVVWISAKGKPFAIRRSKNTGNLYRQNLTSN